jgi:hypothetical protein
MATVFFVPASAIPESALFTRKNGGQVGFEREPTAE